MAEVEGDKVTLEIVVASHRAILCYNEKLLILGPTQPFYGALIPLQSISPSQLSRA